MVLLKEARVSGASPQAESNFVFPQKKSSDLRKKKIFRRLPSSIQDFSRNLVILDGFWDFPLSFGNKQSKNMEEKQQNNFRPDNLEIFKKFCPENPEVEIVDPTGA